MAQFSTNIKVTNPENPKEVTHIVHLPILYSIQDLNRVILVFIQIAFYCEIEFKFYWKPNIILNT